MAEQRILLELEQGPQAAREPTPPDALKLKTPNRNQFTFAAVDVEALIGPDHPARAIWELAGRLNLDGLDAPLRTRQGLAGRPAWPPRLLVAVWVWALSEGIGSARQIERLSEHHPALLWLCGLEVISHQTLSDFRSSHSEALDQLFTEVLALLSEEGLIELEQVTVDGTRLRSQASSSSRCRRPTLERHLEAARQRVAEWQDSEQSEQVTQQRQAARRRAARERVERLTQALAELQKVEAAKKTPQEREQARVSATEPEARVQHESNGGYGVGYNAQLATDEKHKIVVGVELTSCASDAEQLMPTLSDVERCMDDKPRQALADASYARRANVGATAAAEVEFVSPPPDPQRACRAAEKAAGLAWEFRAHVFVYDEGADVLRCPQGKDLAFQRGSTKRERTYRQ